MRRNLILSLLVLTAFAFLASARAEKATKAVPVRIGHFPNITHAQIVASHARGTLEKRLAPSAKVEWKIFNAGPSAVEAIFSGNLDIAVIGPSPAVNGYVKSMGQAMRIVAGSCSGGAALVLPQDSPVKSAEDLHGKKIASPQLGNTQDVALRAWLRGSGLKLKEVGGDVQVTPLSNADILTLFTKKEIDGAWTVEPWVATLEQKAGGKIFLDEADLWARGRYATAVVVVSGKFLKNNPGLVKAFLEEHVEMTEWIKANPKEAGEVIRAEIVKETGKDIPADLFDRAFSRIEPTYDPLVSTILEQADAAFREGFLKKKPDLTYLVDTALLEEVLKAKGLASPEKLEGSPEK